VCRLKAGWQQEWETWHQRDLTGKRYVYFWVDGLQLNVRMDDAPCLLVVIGATLDRHKELVAVEDGVRESEHSWKALLLNLKRRWLAVGPDLAIGETAPWDSGRPCRKSMRPHSGNGVGCIRRRTC
jgi:transposase-like protein